MELTRYYCDAYFVDWIAKMKRAEAEKFGKPVDEEWPFAVVLASEADAALAEKDAETGTVRRLLKESMNHAMAHAKKAEAAESELADRENDVLLAVNQRIEAERERDELRRLLKRCAMAMPDNEDIEEARAKLADLERKG